jgi:hypothetical protein
MIGIWCSKRVQVGSGLGLGSQSNLGNDALLINFFFSVFKNLKSRLYIHVLITSTN